ncbi:Flp family type IVb pilin [Rhizobium sp. LCM 4573]|uniref:Flp family type IVb pilin n=1 Tax=Rhizobium sp. LCM 4573 TaxID=1848291 RepID=UPI0008D9E879|nr:Flp family type IVb pilin [Rhizobium sp. LCM 4573]OHV82024.1 pilus assembly protein [Rhizobium sp. LCM 4573]
MHLLRSFLRDSHGASAVEYGLIAAIIGGALILGLGAFSEALQNTFTTVENSIEKPIN